MKIIIKGGEKYYKLTIIKEIEPNKYIRRVLCKCECGKTTETYWSSLKKGHVKSCGCLHTKQVKELWYNNKKHGLYKHKYYSILKAMINRCHNPKDQNYKYYGAKGYIVCKEWREDLKKWLDFLSKISFEGCDFDKDYKCKKLWLKEYSPRTVIAITHKENLKIIN